ncbi:MAG: hypothetical protein HOC24_03315 [Deltaproteobacteria bacterium]|jgi:hypothetical protein|nr:hypothetical protein [Deltaproteobacteria bacterium]
MEFRISKIEVAIEQLDWSIRLFLSHKAYIPAITLAGAAEEILGANLRNIDSEPAFIEVRRALSDQAGIDLNEAGRDINAPKNWLKHWTNKKDSLEISADIESAAIQYIIRAETNLFKFDNSVTNEFPAFWDWLSVYKPELISS